MRWYIEGAIWIVPVVALVWAVPYLPYRASAQEPQKDPLATCSLELERLRAYATIIKGDRDQKEAALASYGQQVQALTAELAKLKEKP